MGVNGNVKPNDDEDSSSQLGPREIRKEFWIKKYQLTWAKKDILKYPQMWLTDLHIFAGIDIVYRKWLKNQGIQEHIYNFDRPGNAKRRFSLTAPCL